MPYTLQTKQFVREATGLIREFGAIDTLLFASAFVFALVFTIEQFPWFYGNTLGADLTSSLLLASIPFLFLMATYWVIGVLMPRTGNDYVWVGRIFRPSIGFAWSLLYMITVFLVAYVAEIGPFATAVSSVFGTYGLISNSSYLTDLGTFFGGPLGTFELATLFTVIFGLFAIFGSRFIKGLLYVTWAVAIIGFLLMWYIMGTTSNGTFVTNWNTLMTPINSTYSYAALQSTAVKAASFPGLSTGFAAVVTALPLAFLFLFGGNYANGFAGEIKNIRKSMPIALFLSLLFGVVYWSITSTLTLNAVGHDWLTEVGYGWISGGSSPGTASYPLPFQPTQPLFLAVAAYPNYALITIMFVTYLVGSLGALFAYFWIPSKYIFAWAFDRVIPSKFADVNQRFHTPYLAVTAVVIIGVILSYLYAILGYSTLFTMGTVVWGVSYVIPGLALMAFPYAKKDLFAQAPGWMGRKVASIPIVSIIGLATAIGFAYVGYVAYSNPIITAPNQFSFILIAFLVILAFVIYFVSKSYYRSKGIDVSLALKEIPPE